MSQYTFDDVVNWIKANRPELLFMIPPGHEWHMRCTMFENIEKATGVNIPLWERPDRAYKLCMDALTASKQLSYKPLITREPDSVKGWYCRSKDGAFGFGETPRKAYLSWMDFRHKMKATARRDKKINIASIFGF